MAGSESVGSVSFDIKLNDGEFKTGVKKAGGFADSIIGKGFKKAGQSITNSFGKTTKSLTSSATTSAKSIANSYARALNTAKLKAIDAQTALDSINKKMAEMGAIAQKDKSQSIAKMKDEIKETEKAIDELIAKQQAVIDGQRKNTAKKHNITGEVPENVLNNDLSSNTAFNELEKQIGKLSNTLQSLQSKSTAIQGELADGTKPATTEYQKLNNQAEKLNTTLEQQSNKIKYLNGQMDGLAQKTSLLSRLQSGLKGVFSKALSGLKAVGSAIGKVAKTAGGIMGKAGKGGMKLIGSGIKNISEHTKKAGNSVSSFGSRIKNLVGAALVFNVIRKALSSLSQSLGSAVMSNKQFAGSLSQIKGNLLTAFAPIFSAIMPALNVLMSALSQVTAYFAAFMAMLFGKTATASQGAAKSLNAQAGAYGSAGKAAKKAAGFVAGFDELNNVNKEEDDESGGGGGGGGGGEAPSFSMDLSPMDAFFAKFETLKEAFYNVGASIATSINDAFNKIDWAGIQQKVFTGMQALAYLFNGFVDYLDWGLLGSTIGNGINTLLYGINTFVNNFNWGKLGTSLAVGLNSAINTVDWGALGEFLANKFVIIINVLYGFVTTFDWKKFGTALSTSVNSFFNAIDWKKAGKTVSTGLKGIFDSIFTFIAGVEWYKIGTDIRDFLVAIDWAGVVAGLAKAVGAAIGGLASLLYGVIGDAVQSIGDYFSKKFDEAGGNIVVGLFNGIIDAFKGIGQWIYDNIFAPFINGFKSVFGIHSPSTVMSEQGNFIMEGLKQGISNMLSSVLSVITEIMDGIKNIILVVWETIKTSLTAILDGIKSVVTTVFNAISQVVSTITNTIKTVITSIWEAIRSVISTILETISNIFSSVFNGISNTISSIFDGVKNFVVSLWESISNVLSVIIHGISDMFTNVFTGMKDSVINIFDGIWSGIKGVINSILSGVEGMANGVVNGINTMINALNTISFDIPDWVPALGGKSFGINIPTVPGVQLPRLAQGGIIDKPTVAMVGEAGKEAVVPLENNTEWIDKIANRIGAVLSAQIAMLNLSGNGNNDNTNQPIVLEIDGRRLGEIMLPEIRQAAKRSGIEIVNN